MKLNEMKLFTALLFVAIIVNIYKIATFDNTPTSLAFSLVALVCLFAVAILEQMEAGGK